MLKFSLSDSSLVLGIHTGVDPAVALVRNGRLESFSEEERHVRYKHAPAMFPYRAIKNCLASASIKPEEIDAIAINWDLDAFNDGRIERFYDDLSKTYPVDSGTKGWQRKNIAERNFTSLTRLYTGVWRKLFGLRNLPAIRGVSHHFGHAHQAYMQSPFDDAICLTIDGSGDTECTVVWRCTNGRLERLKSFDMPHSLGWFYSAFTEYLGFDAYDGEYKVMGLAAYGRPREDILQLLNSVLQFDADGVGYRLNPSYIHYGDHSYSGRFTDELVALFGREPRREDQPITEWHEDLAYAVQSMLEAAVCRLVAWAIKTTGTQNICIGGGVGLNVKMNSKIFSMKGVKAVFAHPLCSDSGTAAAAAFVVSEQLSGHVPEKLHSLSLGHKETNEGIEKALLASKLSYRRSDDITKDVSQALAGGAIVGWFQGGMEAGPRALGNRSILADPRSIENRDKVNAIVKFREYWRPFCPSLPTEAVPLFFDRYCDAPFMIVAFESNSLLKKLAPAIVHIDNSVRLQAVDKEVNPLYHRLLNAFGALTGVPVLLNTSFNVKGEPIVCTAADAIRTFAATGLDILAIGDYILEKSAVRNGAAVHAAVLPSSNSEPVYETISQPRALVKKQALFVGSHPDDIEIGAGGTLARMVDKGWDVHACIATDDTEPRLAAVRRREALDAFASLGVKADHVLFLGMRDSGVSVNGDSVGRFREILSQRGIAPMLVFTHTEADSHNDHRAVRELVHATFRRQVIVGFPVINSLNKSAFAPKLFSDISASLPRKTAALEIHQTQVANGRVSVADVREFNRTTGPLRFASFVEPFDISLQYGGLDSKALHNIFSEIGLSDAAEPSKNGRKIYAQRPTTVKAKSNSSKSHTRLNGQRSLKAASEKRV
ncbi:MAG TPA: carbamoyltransferase C-terminal domain-containing protein [Terriglobales bacterium]